MSVSFKSFCGINWMQFDGLRINQLDSRYVLYIDGEAIAVMSRTRDYTRQRYFQIRMMLQSVTVAWIEDRFSGELVSTLVAAGVPQV